MIDPSELPLCAVCGVRVERLEFVFHPTAHAGMGAHSLVAYCHGQTDVVDISDLDLLAMVPGSVQGGVAFAADEVDLRDSAFRQPGPYAPIRDGRPRRLG